MVATLGTMLGSINNGWIIATTALGLAAGASNIVMLSMAVSQNSGDAISWIFLGLSIASEIPRRCCYCYKSC